VEPESLPSDFLTQSYMTFNFTTYDLPYHADTMDLIGNLFCVRNRHNYMDAIYGPDDPELIVVGTYTLATTSRYCSRRAAINATIHFGGLAKFHCHFPWKLNPPI
jgi:hypothetical protein